jgi:hypothetical protein
VSKRKSASMGTKKRVKPFSAVTAVKAAAREAVGAPPPTRKAPDTKAKLKHKAGKHKPTLGEMINAEE